MDFILMYLKIVTWYIGLCSVIRVPVTRIYTVRIKSRETDLVKHGFYHITALHKAQLGEKKKIFLSASPIIDRHQEGTCIWIIACQIYFLSCSKTARFN